jgi:cation diffusion facilitator family transporter
MSADRTRANERRTRLVLGLTVGTMLAELAAGIWTGSLALQADGWHMATHAGALALAAFGYWFARTRANDTTFVFGTGKVNALTGFASAVALGVVALFMILEGIERLLAPEEIAFASALPVAVLGLVVNLGSLFLLGGDQGHGHGGHGHGHGGHGHGHGGHGHGHDEHGHDEHGHDEHGHDERDGHGHGHETDHNLRGVYLHVLADSITSVLAIAALALGAWLGVVWVDALTALVAAVLILVWARGLVRDTAGPLLDARAPAGEIARMEKALEAIAGVTRVSVCMWDLGSGRRAVAVELTADRALTAREVRAAVPALTRCVRATIEIHPAQEA